jgi:NAD(P)-dependent dehydrogenase (short-subunit alcohol dehydrogenase family)
MVNDNARTVLVTGASYGFGELIADLMARKGYQVYGTSRTQHPDRPSGVKMRVMEVTDKDSVRACIAGIVREAGRLDILINNAGLSQLSLAEETALEDVDRLVATNLLGPMYTTLTALPFLRENGGGRIITISSISGIMGFPGYSAYCGGKFGIEGFMESLAYEVEGQNIHVSIVEPATYQTGLIMRQVKSVHQLPVYDPVRQRVMTYMESNLAKGKDPHILANRVVQIAETAKPKLRYRVGFDTHMAFYLRKLLPFGVVRQIFRSMMKMPAR